MNNAIDDPLTSHVRPATDSVITVRIIKSFPYRNIKNYIMKNANLKELTPEQLLENITTVIRNERSLRPYSNIEYDSLKVYSKAHESKSMNLVINIDDDDEKTVICKKGKGLDKSLWKLDIENETEISLFNWNDYVAYKDHPEEKW